MKRDLELIRRILEEVESSEKCVIYDYSSDSARLEVSDSELIHNVRLMAEHGLIHAERTNRSVVLKSLTWKGHDFLENIQDQTIWNEVKKHGVHISFSAVQEMIVDLAKAAARKAIQASPLVVHHLSDLL